jgi:hypothetical protein
MAYVKFELSDGTSVYIESSDSPRGNSGLIPRGAAEAAEQSGHPFAEAVAPLSKMAQAMMDGLRSPEGENPTDVQINFAVKAVPDLGSGLVIARAGADTNFTVTVRWQKDKAAAETDEKKD